MITLMVSDISILVKRKKIKNIHLSVNPPDGEVRISVPEELSDESIKLFAISKISWIKRQQRKYEDQERLTPREFINRESHYFKGQRYLLNIIELDKPPKVEIQNNTYINLYVRPDASTEKKNQVMNNWYRNYLKKAIPQIISKWEGLIGVKVNEWHIRKMKTKWGSCNIEKKDIFINLELAKKKINCLEYIIVHEMVHLLERKHNNRFLEYMNVFLPNWKKLRQELNASPLTHEDWDY